MSAQTFRQARDMLGKPSPARERLAMLFDADSFVELDGFVMTGDEPAGVVCGYGAVMGSPACAFAQDGSGFGRAQATKIAKLYDLALKTGIPVVGIYDSAGARVAEGADVLAAYSELLLRINNLSGVVPQISLVAGTCAGSSALLACCADFVVMTKDAQFFMTPPALSQDKVEGAGTAEAAAKAGIAHVVADTDAEAIDAVKQMLIRLPLNNLAASPVLDFAAPAEALPAAGAPGKDLAAAFCDSGSVVELLGGFADDCAYTALASMAGYPVGIVAASGKLCADGCNKIAKLVNVCDAFQIPVVTFVNAAGFEPSSKAELCGSVREMAKLSHVYAEATTAKVAVITGKAYGAAYVALAGRAANSDYTIAWPDAVISPLEPQTAVAFLYADKITAEKSREQVQAEYEQGEASALAAAKAGHLDDVISPEVTRPAILAALDLLSAKRVSRHPKKHGNLPL
ncbi:MAG: carboxyl transferase domain-containing protein [Oscillospiraceae bacterium]|jgi:acetyl-CoA carboxylase carboxyltransferase component